MHKYAAATALVITLNITVLALAVSASLTPANARGLPFARNEGGCDAWGHGLRLYAVICHCGFQCKRQHQYTERLPCNPGQPGWPGGSCNIVVHPVEAVAACVRNCVAAQRAAQH
jgi:hypothetical protein